MTRFLLAILIGGSMQAMDNPELREERLFNNCEPKLILANNVISGVCGIALLADLFYLQSGYLTLPCAIQGGISFFSNYVLNKQRNLLKEFDGHKDTLDNSQYSSLKKKVIAIHHKAEAGLTVNGIIPMLSIFFATNNVQAKLSSSIADECKKEKSWVIPTAIGGWHAINYVFIQKNRTSINEKFDNLKVN